MEEPTLAGPRGEKERGLSLVPSLSAREASKPRSRGIATPIYMSGLSGHCGSRFSRELLIDWVTSFLNSVAILFSSLRYLALGELWSALWTKEQLSLP